jgi:hypothetical protein
MKTRSNSCAVTHVLLSAFVVMKKKARFGFLRGKVPATWEPRYGRPCRFS